MLHNSLPPTNWSIFKMLEPVGRFQGFFLVKPGVTWVFYCTPPMSKDPNGEPAATWIVGFCWWFFYGGRDPMKMKTRWWFQISFIFIPTWGNDPIWLIFFRWVETTNQKITIKSPPFGVFIWLVVSKTLCFYLCRWSYLTCAFFFYGFFQPPTSEPAESFRTLRNHTVQWCSPRILWR